MPLPVIILYVGGTLLAGLGVGAAAYKWRQIVAFFAGKPIAVLGMRETGKSTLREFLTTGEVNSQYVQTRFRNDVSGGASRLRGGLTATSGIDVGGDVSLRKAQWHEAWETAAKGHGYILYLVEAPKVVNKDKEQLARIIGDSSAIRGWIEQRKSTGGGSVPRFAVLATHADKLPGWSADVNSRTKLNDEFRKRHEMAELSELHELDGYCGVALGSLLSKDDAIQFLDDVVSVLKGTPRGAR
jgi:hypothetical protein